MHSQVALVSSTPFEWKYALHVRGVQFPSEAVVRPSGLVGGEAASAWPDPVPLSVDKSAACFLLPKINEAILGLPAALSAAGVPFWTPGLWPDGMQRWGGPRAVAGFRAAVHVPYAPTTFALCESAHGPAGSSSRRVRRRRVAAARPPRDRRATVTGTRTPRRACSPSCPPRR